VSLVGVALPSIGHELNMSTASLQWITLACSWLRPPSGCVRRRWRERSCSTA